MLSWKVNMNAKMLLNLKNFWGELQVYDIHDETVSNMSIAYAQNLSSEQPFPAEDRFHVPVSSAGVKKVLTPPVRIVG
jgi:hypothetical protein